MGQTIGLKTVTARKRHPCAWCSDGIHPGERYEAWLYKDGGDVAGIKAHVECVDTIEAIRARQQAFDDEFPCAEMNHRKGRGCRECAPEEE